MTLLWRVSGKGRVDLVSGGLNLIATTVVAALLNRWWCAVHLASETDGKILHTLSPPLFLLYSLSTSLSQIHTGNGEVAW
jgi:hypothetical protein